MFLLFLPKFAITEKFEDTKEVNRWRKSKGRQYNVTKRQKNKQWYTNTVHKPKDRAPETL